MVSSCVRLIVTLSGRLLVGIRSLVVIARLGVARQCGCSLTAPTFVTPKFREFFRLGKVLRVTLPTGEGVYGYQGCEEDADKLALTDKLLQAVLAEAQVVCGAAAACCGRLEC